jgi:prepilin peptidase dependent protein B
MLINRNRRVQRGVTLAELLVGMAVGLIVVGGAIQVYVSTIQGSNDTLRSSKLNQELSALMSVIVNDVRRAGFWGAINPNALASNPFSQWGATALVVRDDMTNNNLQGPTGQGSCLLYVYDATYLPGNAAGVLEATDLFGFRLTDSGVVQMRQVGVVDGAACVGGTCTSCTNGTWENVTDPNLINITELTFDLGNSQCLNASEPNGIDNNGNGTVDDASELDCYATIPANASGDITVETREVTIRVTGSLAADASVQATATQSVRVRNDLIRIR